MRFLTIIDRYLFKLSLKSLLSLSSIVITIIWLSQSMRSLDLIVNNDAGVFTYLLIVMFLIPELLAVSLPICLLISGMNLFQKLISTHEITILRSSGFSNVRVARPFLILCLCSTIFTTIMSVYVTPFAISKFNVSRHKIEEDVTSSVIHPGAFNKFNQAIVYVKEISRKGRMQDLYLNVDPTADKNGFTIIAKSGCITKKDGKLRFILNDCTRQDIDKATLKISSAYFENFTYDLSELLKKEHHRHIRPYERSTVDLLKADFVGDDLILKKRVQTEAHKRILMPWMNVLFGMIITATLLYGDIQRRKRYIKVIIGSVVCVISYVAFLSLIESAQENVIGIYWLYVFMFITSFLAFYILKASKIWWIDWFVSYMKGFKIKNVFKTKIR
ncbi:MAG: hypothetical protein HEEMFOPI_00142 [Holosporales bacterium]